MTDAMGETLELGSDRVRRWRLALGGEDLKPAELDQDDEL